VYTIKIATFGFEFTIVTLNRKMLFVRN